MDAFEQEDRHLSASNWGSGAVIERVCGTTASDARCVQSFDEAPSPVVHGDILECLGIRDVYDRDREGFGGAQGTTVGGTNTDAIAILDFEVEGGSGLQIGAADRKGSIIRASAEGIGEAVTNIRVRGGECAHKCANGLIFVDRVIGETDICWRVVGGIDGQGTVDIGEGIVIIRAAGADDGIGTRSGVSAADGAGGLCVDDGAGFAVDEAGIAEGEGRIGIARNDCLVAGCDGQCHLVDQIIDCAIGVVVVAGAVDECPNVTIIGAYICMGGRR